MVSELKQYNKYSLVYFVPRWSKYFDSSSLKNRIGDVKSLKNINFRVEISKYFDSRLDSFIRE